MKNKQTETELKDMSFFELNEIFKTLVIVKDNFVREDPKDNYRLDLVLQFMDRKVDKYFGEENH